MFEYLYEWMKNIAFYMVLITAVIHILPNSDYKKYIRFFTGMVLVVMLATPLLKIFGMEHPLGSLYNSKEYQEQMKKIEEESKYLGETLPEGYPDAVSYTHLVGQQAHLGVMAGNVNQCVRLFL